MKGDEITMSIERINNDESNQALIEKLRAIIEIESSKPISEQDVDLIDECVDYLMELENGIELTDEELEKGKKQIYMLLDKNKKPQKKLSFKGLLIAACLAILILLANFVALACGINTVSILKEWGHNIIEMFEGEKEEYGGVTIIKENESLSFDSINDFKNNTSFNVLCPMVLPDGVDLKKIKVTGSYDANNNYISDYHSIFFVTTNPQISVIVHTNPDYPKEFMNSSKIIIEEIDDHICYYFEEELSVRGYFVYDNATYAIKAQDLDELKNIIENFKEN